MKKKSTHNSTELKLFTKINKAISLKTDFCNSLLGISTLAIIVALLSSLASFLFIEFFRFVESLLYYDGEGHTQLAQGWVLGDWKLLIILPLGGLLVGLITYYIMPSKKNVGLVGIIEATHKNRGLISLREGVGVGLVSAVSIGSGASVGRYGPAVHIGASIGSWLTQILYLTRKSRLTLLGAGAAAAIASSFNAPFAAVIFTHEVIIKNYSIKTFAPITLAATVGAILGNYYEPQHMFESFVLLRLIGFEQFMIAGFIGITGAFIAIIFMKVLMMGQSVGAMVKLDSRFKPVLGGLILACIALLFPQTLGLSSYMVKSVISSNLDFGWINFNAENMLNLILFLSVLLFIKMVAVSLSFGFGFNGGLVGPAMFVGAIYGSIVANIIFSFNYSYIDVLPLYSLIGLASIISVVFGAPIATVILVLELSGSYNVTSGVLIAVALANIISLKFFSKSYFDLMLNKKGVDMSEGIETILMKNINITNIMKTDVIMVDVNDNYETIKDALNKANNMQEVFVVEKDKHNKLLGIINPVLLIDIENQATITAKTVMDTMTKTICKDNDILEAFEFAKDYVGLTVPIIKNQKTRSLIGYLTEGDLIHKYQSSIKEARKEEQGLD